MTNSRRHHRRLAVFNRFVAIAATRAGRTESVRKRSPSFRPLTGAEAEALLGDELLAALSDALRHA